MVTRVKLQESVEHGNWLKQILTK